MVGAEGGVELSWVHMEAVVVAEALEVEVVEAA